MGRERAGAGKCFCLCIAALILLDSGCATIKEKQHELEAGGRLRNAGRLLAAADYKGALHNTKMALDLLDKTPASDKALFQMGLIYAHQGNPSKDYRQAVMYFRRLVDNYPVSTLAENAHIWIGVLKEIIRLEDKLVQSQSKLLQTEQELGKAKEMLEKAKQIDMEIERKKKLLR